MLENLNICKSFQNVELKQTIELSKHQKTFSSEHNILAVKSI